MQKMIPERIRLKALILAVGLCASGVAGCERKVGPQPNDNAELESDSPLNIRVFFDGRRIDRQLTPLGPNGPVIRVKQSADSDELVINITNCGIQANRSLNFVSEKQGALFMVVTEYQSYQGRTDCWISQRLYFVEDSKKGEQKLTTVFYQAGSNFPMLVDGLSSKMVVGPTFKPELTQEEPIIPGVP